MSNGAPSPSTHTDLVDLGRRLYERALVRRGDEHLTDPRGRPIGWLLDIRIPMLDAAMFSEVGQVLADRLRSKGACQVAGHGFGAYAMVCSVLAAEGSPPFTAGFVRESRKPHGRRRLIEGPLDRGKPVVLLDDILNSGRSAMRAISQLRQDGFEVAGVMTLFNFAWSGGKAQVEKDGVWVDSLLELNLREEKRDKSDPA
jgi:orotate phosphoribosyltransferase